MDKKLEHALTTLRHSPRAWSTEFKNKALLSLATGIEKASANILGENAKDLAALPPDTANAFRDRLTLNGARLMAMVESLRQVAALPDPVGEVIEQRTLPNGLKLRKVRAPLGLILMIFESRPNVITEAFSLAFKSGNAIILRGGSESKFTASAIFQVMYACLGPEVFLGIQDYDRAHVASMLGRKDLIDIVVPRGGERLIEYVQSTATMPIIKNDRGLCHAFVDESADLDMALKIVVNAKVSRPGVCNSLETVLVHKAVAEEFIPKLHAAMNVEWKADEATRALLAGKPQVTAATVESWDTEYLDLILNCRVVENLDQALMHIAKHGSKHSETIITKSEVNARRFQNEIDAAVVYWNASTRFTDGFEFGLGGELGISTQKLHVRGPVGLRELTTPRWLADGSGQIR